VPLLDEERVVGIINTNWEYWSDAALDRRSQKMASDRKERRFARYRLAAKMKHGMATNDDVPLGATMNIDPSGSLKELASKSSVITRKRIRRVTKGNSYEP
jgi:hypothetical protein